MDGENLYCEKLENINDALKDKLDKLQISREKYVSLHQRKFNDQRQTICKKNADSFRDLGESCEKLVKLYKRSPVMKSHKDGEVLFYKRPMDNYYAEEDNFTHTLTGFTRKQFFEGIVELAETEETSKYDLLDVLKPSTSLLQEDKENIREQDQEELRRLQSQYSLSEKKRINSTMTRFKYRKAVEVAEKQLAMVKFQDYNFSNDHFGEMIEKLNRDSKLLKENSTKMIASQLYQLLEDLESLNSAIILKGNYDLKIARQDYFISKQSELITQLLMQFSRGYFLSILYDIERSQHSGIYHLMFSVKSLLEKEVKSIRRRIDMLTDPLLSSHSMKEIIRSSDLFANRIYNAIANHSEEELYHRYNDLISGANNLAEYRQMVSDENTCARRTRDRNFQSLKHSSVMDKNVTNYEIEDSNENISSIIAKIEEALSTAESQINAEISFISNKRTNQLDMMKRSIFPDFFNDPLRLKRKQNELISRVKACT